MKKKRLLALLIFISLFIIFFPVENPFFAIADGQTSGAEEELNESIKEQIEQLDLDDLQKYLNELGLEGASAVERLIAYIGGEEIDYVGFGKQIISVLFAKVSDILPAFACIAAITLLSGLINALKSGINGHTSAEMIFLIAYGGALIPLLAILTECIGDCVSCVSSLQNQMQLIFPLMLTLMAASGSTLSVSVCRPTVGFFCTTIVAVIQKVVFPITVAVILFSLAAHLTRELKIGKFTAFFKSINKWIIGVCVSVFGIFFTLQGITTATHDGILRRATKYAIGNGIPIIGGFLSGGFDLAVAGSVLIKNSLGTMGIFLMITVLFEPIVLLASVNLLLRLTAAITQPFGDSRLSDFLGETADNLHYCTAGLLMTAFLYFLSIMLMIYSTEALF